MDPLVWIGIGVAVLLAAGGFLFWRLRPEKEETVFHCNCPGCGRRLRYRLAQAGRTVTCPLCKKPLTFPAVQTKAR